MANEQVSRNHMFRQALVGGIYLTWVKDTSYDKVVRLPGVVPSDPSQRVREEVRVGNPLVRRELNLFPD